MSLRIDAHVLLLPEEYTAELDRRSLLSSPLPPWSPELLDELMARHEIDAAVLSLSPPGVWFGDGPLAVELARMVNERTAELAPSWFGRIPRASRASRCCPCRRSKRRSTR